MAKRPAKLENSFFDDSGQNAGAGHKGNSVDYSQRYAESDADNSEEPDEAERMARTLHRMPEFRYAFFLNDPIERQKWVQRYREALNGQPNSTAKKLQEPEEEPSLSRAADDKFWNSEEPKKVMPRKL